MATVNGLAAKVGFIIAADIIPVTLNGRDAKIQVPVDAQRAIKAMLAERGKRAYEGFVADGTAAQSEMQARMYGRYSDH